MKEELHVFFCISSSTERILNISMLPTNLFIVSMVVFLATVSMAPVEEKEQEQEEVEVEATEEGELSEEEEDDDDSKSQDKIEGVVGERPTATAAPPGGSDAAAALSSNIQDVSASSSQSAGGSYGTAGSSKGHGSEFSMDSEAAGVESSSTTSQTGPDRVESNGNGQKLMNAGDVGGGADSQTVISSGGTAAQSVNKSNGSSLDSLSDPAHHADISVNQSGPDHSSLSSGTDQSHSSSYFVSGFSHSAVQGDAADSSSSSHSEVQRVQTEGANLPDTNGNGRQTLLTNTNTEVLVVSAGGAESGLHIELTGLELGHDVTVSPPAVLHTDRLPSVSHGYSHTELISMATDSTGIYTVSADPTGTPFDFSHPAVTDHTQMAGQVTEQYYPSGQGPEGTKNVELEDTC